MFVFQGDDVYCLREWGRVALSNLVIVPHNIAIPLYYLSCPTSLCMYVCMYVLVSAGALEASQLYPFPPLSSSDL